MNEQNHEVPYGEPVENEPLARAKNRREGRGPLASATAGVPLQRLTGADGKPWKVADNDR